jgi:HEAT repeat protein
MTRFWLSGIVAFLPALALAQPPDLPKPARPAAQQYKELIPTLIEALNDSDLEVRQYSALALAAVGADALPALKEALQDKCRERRSAAAYALGQMGASAREAIPELLKTVQDEDTMVKRSAAQALSRIITRDVAYQNSATVRQFASTPSAPPLAPLELPIKPPDSKSGK